MDNRNWWCSDDWQLVKATSQCTGKSSPAYLKKKRWRHLQDAATVFFIASFDNACQLLSLQSGCCQLGKTWWDRSPNFISTAWSKTFFFALVALLPRTNDLGVALEKAQERTLVQFVMLYLHDGATYEMTNPVTGMESSLCHSSLGFLTVDDQIMLLQTPR
ncbi:MAG: hypothetical protein IPN76_30540 [Saprospiraceae bacterium]|nr:hypothetical protein [Saprospiraceae bacterium]